MSVTAINSLSDLFALTTANLGGDFKLMRDILAYSTNPANVDAWDSGGVYNEGDYCSDAGKTYLCILDGYVGQGAGEANLEDFEEWESYFEVAYTSEGASPIAEGANRFSGTFDGNGHAIIGLYINRPGTVKQSLFGLGQDCNVSNLALIDCDITGGQESCPIFCGLTGSYNVSKCYATGTVTSAGLYPTGLFGSLTGTGVISDVYSFCDVSGQNSAGCVAYVGANNTIRRAYSTGQVTGTGAKGFVSIAPAGTMEDCYWDTEASGITAANTGATGLTTAELQQLWNITNDFDWVNDWFQPIGGYPELRVFHGKYKRRKGINDGNNIHYR